MMVIVSSVTVYAVVVALNSYDNAVFLHKF